MPGLDNNLKVKLSFVTQSNFLHFPKQPRQSNSQNKVLGEQHKRIYAIQLLFALFKEKAQKPEEKVVLSLKHMSDKETHNLKGPIANQIVRS